jgi:hypothetical protein
MAGKMLSLILPACHLPLTAASKTTGIRVVIQRAFGQTAALMLMTIFWSAPWGPCRTDHQRPLNSSNPKDSLLAQSA